MIYEFTFFILSFPFQVTIPPKVVPSPQRITCRYVKSENLLYPPTLNEGEGKRTHDLGEREREKKIIPDRRRSIPTYLPAYLESIQLQLMIELRQRSCQEVKIQQDQVRQWYCSRRVLRSSIQIHASTVRLVELLCMKLKKYLRLHCLILMEFQFFRSFLSSVRRFIIAIRQHVYVQYLVLRVALDSHSRLHTAYCVRTILVATSLIPEKDYTPCKGPDIYVLILPLLTHILSPTKPGRSYQRQNSCIKIHRGKKQIIFSYTRLMHKTMALIRYHPSKFFSALQSYCSRISVGLPSYDSRSTLIRLDGSKIFGRVSRYISSAANFFPLFLEI